MSILWVKISAKRSIIKRVSRQQLKELMQYGKDELIYSAVGSDASQGIVLGSIGQQFILKSLNMIELQGV